MSNSAISIFLFIFTVCLSYGKLYHGIGMQMTTDGAGIYYKQLCSLTENSQITSDYGLHFDDSQPRIDVFGYDNNYQNMLVDLTAGYRHELFSNYLRGPFRPLFILGTGGVADIQSFSKDNIAGIWMIKYMLGLGIQFYNRNNLNELSLHFMHSKTIERNVVFQLAYYWE